MRDSCLPLAKPVCSTLIPLATVVKSIIKILYLVQKMCRRQFFYSLCLSAVSDL